MTPVWIEEYGDAVIGVAVRAGEAVLKWWRQDGLVVEHKKDDSPVTKADRESQAILVAGLRAINPCVQIVGEESEPSVSHDVQQDQPFWLLDPLDGTKEFVAGSDEFVVCMGYVEQGVATWGLIHCPVTEVTVVGAAGYGGSIGAWECKGTGVWRELCARRSGKGCLFLGSVHSASPQEQSVIGRLKSRGAEVGIKPMGSALKFIEIARGQASGYLRYGPTCGWDVAAGQAIVRGAGGDVFDWSGRGLGFVPDHSARNPSFVCVGDDAALHEEILEAVRAVGGRA